MSNIVQEILENAAMTANMTVLYNVFVGKPTETATVENINQAVSMLFVNNKFTKEDIKDDIMNAQAIAMVVNKQNKKTIGFGMIRKPNLEKKIQIFKDADNEELSSEYIFESSTKSDNSFIYRSVADGLYSTLCFLICCF